MPMSDEKRGLESGALNQFAEALEELWGSTRFAFKELRDPPSLMVSVSLMESHYTWRWATSTELSPMRNNSLGERENPRHHVRIS